MKNKFKVTLFCIVILLCSLISSREVLSEEDSQWQPVPEVNYAEVLKLIALRAKANYDEISSWQGRMNISETSHFYGTDAAQKSYAVDTTNSIASNSKHICEIANTVAEFAVDMRNDKLYSKVDPNVYYKAVDLNQIVPARKETRVPKTRTILSPESYMWYITDGKFHSKSRKGPPDKMVFVESSGNDNVKGFVRDPRKYFDSGGENRMLWETILQIRTHMDERLNTRVADYPHIEITLLETEDGTKYRILTTWKGAEHYVIKYIRCLLEVDEAVGFNALRTETTNPDGIKTDSKEYTYEKIGEIYIPKTVKKEQRNNKGEITFTSEITIETTGLNKPLPEDTFTIKNLGLEEDTLVTDNIKKAEFRYSKGVLVPISEPNNP